MGKDEIAAFLADPERLEAFATAEWQLAEEAKRQRFYDDASALKRTAAQAAMLASQARGAQGWGFYGGPL